MHSVPGFLRQFTARLTRRNRSCKTHGRAKAAPIISTLRGVGDQRGRLAGPKRRRRRNRIRLCPLGACGLKHRFLPLQCPCEGPSCGPWSAGRPGRSRSSRFAVGTTSPSSDKSRLTSRSAHAYDAARPSCRTRLSLKFARPIWWTLCATSMASC